MAKNTTSKRAVNKYPHNLHAATIVNDENSFESKGIRYLLYTVPTKEEEGIVIDISNADLHSFSLQAFKRYF